MVDNAGLDRFRLQTCTTFRHIDEMGFTRWPHVLRYVWIGTPINRGRIHDHDRLFEVAGAWCMSPRRSPWRYAAAWLPRRLWSGGAKEYCARRRSGTSERVAELPRLSPGPDDSRSDD